MKSDELFVLIYELIEAEIISKKGNIIYAEIQDKIYTKFNISIGLQRIANICNEISENNNIPLQISRISRKSREMQDVYEIAEHLGITDEEVYLSHLHGYTYTSMCELFYQMTRKTIKPDFFRQKLKRYCQEKNIPTLRVRVKVPKECNFIEEVKNDGIQHSKFFMQLHYDYSHRTKAIRQIALEDIHSPYKKLIDNNEER